MSSEFTAHPRAAMLDGGESSHFRLFRVKSVWSLGRNGERIIMNWPDGSYRNAGHKSVVLIKKVYLSVGFIRRMI